jgi:hypothetical protein
MPGPQRTLIAVAAALAVAAVTVIGAREIALGRATSADASAPSPVTSTAPTSEPSPPRPSASTSTGGTRPEAPAHAAATPATQTPQPGTTSQPVTAQSLTASLATVLGTGNSFSVAAQNLTTGQAITAGASSGMSEASLVKLDILDTALYRQQQGQPINQSNAIAMMDNSDNVAADQIFHAVGGNDGLYAYNSLLPLQQTVLDPDGVWGLSTTSAADQLLLLKALVAPNSALSAASRQYGLQLMSNVEADQQWGVSAAADTNATTQLKNGWLDIDSDGGLWAVNSAGLTTVHGDKVLLVVLSQHQPDFQTGVDRVQLAAQQLAAAVT